MIRRFIFVCFLVPMWLALLVAPSLAAPLTSQIGGVHVFVVISPDPPAAMKQNNPMPNASMSQSAGLMAGNDTSGDASAWRNATFALIAVMLIGALVLWRNRRSLTISLLVAGLVIVGIAFAQSRHGSSGTDMVSMQAARGSAPVPVTLARIGDDPSGMTIAAPANVQPYLVQNIVARVPGLLAALSAYTGDRLFAGEIVAHLQEPELQSNAQAALAAAAAAQSQQISAQGYTASMRADLSAAGENVRYWDAEIARERELLRQGAVSVQEYQNERDQAAGARSAYESAGAKLASASAAAQGAQSQVAQAVANAKSQSVTAGYANVIVPNDAVVMKRLVDPGVYVQAGTPILQVAVIDRLRVQAQVAQQDLADVQIGTPIDVIFGNGKTFHGHVSSVSPVVDPTTHTAIAEAIVPNTNDAYQPGGFVHVILHAQGSGHRDSFSVPSGAIVGGATTAVWTDVNNAAHRVPVTVISDDGTNAQVRGNLRPGARVVVTGASDLEEGQAIAQVAP